MNSPFPFQPARAMLLAGAAVIAHPAMAETRADTLATASAADQPSDAAQADRSATDTDSEFDENEIVVTAPRLAGQLDTDIAAEAELDEAEIASYGASSVEELIQALEPRTRSGRGRGSGRPVMLVNGRRISGFGAIRNIPPEAIAKVEIFPEEVALQYGYSATERVVNFVLKPNFRQMSIEGEAGLATQGGRFQSELEPAFTAIGQNGRVNINAGWEQKGMLLESERGLIPAGGTAADAAARSLLAATDQYIIDGTIVRNLDKLTEASLSLRFDQTDSLSLLGRDLTGAGDPLRREGRTQNWTSSASVNGMLGDWRWSMTGNYADADTRTLTDRVGGTRDRSDSSQQSFGANANISGSVMEGWAGPLRASITGGYSGLRFDSRAARGTTVTTTDLARDTPSVFGSLTVPLLDPEYDVGNVGRMSLTLNAQAERPSDFSALTSWGATLNWGLTDKLSLLGSFKYDEVAPGMTQLGAAPLETPAVSYYDFATGQTVQITSLTGGNPFLRAEKRRDIKVGINWEMPWVEGLQFSIDYNRNRSEDTANAFPLLTPEIEAAFGDRVTRDAGGTLIALDQRPVNFDRSTNSQVRWGFNINGSFGENQPAQRPGGARGGAGGGGGEGAGAAGGARSGGDGASPPRPEGARGGEGGPPPQSAGARPPQGGPGAGGGGRGRGPGAGGRGGGGMFGRPQGGRWQASLYHTVKLTDKVLIGPGIPELDLLNGSATGSGGGSNRHLVELDGGMFYKGFGGRLSARYDGGSRVVGGANGDLKFHDLATFNLRFFANLDQMSKVTGALPFLKGSRVRLAIDNLFDAQRRVTDATGNVPVNYLPGYTDPLGRYVELEWRKTF